MTFPKDFDCRIDPIGGFEAAFSHSFVSYKLLSAYRRVTPA